jgi:hypothetical protein
MSFQRSVLSNRQRILATLPEGSPQLGRRGDRVSIGSVLAQLTGAGGLLVTLIGVLKSSVNVSRLGGSNHSARPLKN